ncbi:MAG: hypothetical protein AABW93_01350 [Nanoarchaeota archaeon]
MEKTNIKPKLSDIIPFYGGINYIGRTSFDIEEERPIRDHIERGVVTLAQIVYNSFIGADILNMLEGKPTLTSKILEKILN